MSHKQNGCGHDEYRIKTQLQFDRRSRPYRARDGKIFGVCRGLARHFDMNVSALRGILILAAIMTGFWPVIIGYVIAGLIMRIEPVMPLETEDDAEFYNSYTGSRTLALQRLKRTYENLDRRIQRIEGIVTARDYDWDRRLGEEV